MNILYNILTCCIQGINSHPACLGISTCPPFSNNSDLLYDFILNMTSSTSTTITSK